MINNDSVSLKQPTEIISSNKEINLKSNNKSLTINILPAVSKGLFKISHNIYEKFNVNEHGLKINNATNNPANLIISEVISAEKSNINGNITILGNNKPHLIITNPNGINCSNRCSMTNVNTVSLITSPFEENRPSNQLIDNMREKHIHFKNIKQENFTDVNKIQLLARSVKLESSQLNVNNIIIAVDDNNIIINSVIPMTKLSATKAVHNTDNNLQNSIPSKNARLTIDRHSAINSSGIMNISSVNGNIFNQKELIANNQNYTFINTNFANFGVIKSKGSLAINGQDSVIINKHKIVANNQDYHLLYSRLINNKTIKGNDSFKITALDTAIENNDQLIAKNQKYQLVNSQFKNNEEGTITAYDSNNVDNANRDAAAKLDIALINKASFVDEGQIAIGAQQNDKPTVFPIGKATRYQYGTLNIIKDNTSQLSAAWEQAFTAQ